MSYRGYFHLQHIWLVFKLDILIYMFYFLLLQHAHKYKEGKFEYKIYSSDQQNLFYILTNKFS